MRNDDFYDYFRFFLSDTILTLFNTIVINVAQKIKPVRCNLLTSTDFKETGDDYGTMRYILKKSYYSTNEKSNRYYHLFYDMHDAYHSIYLPTTYVKSEAQPG